MINSTILIFLVLIFHTYNTELTFGILPKDPNSSTGDFSKLRNSIPQFLTTKTSLNSKNSGYLVILIPSFDRTKVFMGTYSTSNPPPLENSPFKLTLPSNPEEDLKHQEQVGTASGYFRKLKDEKGVKEVAESLLSDSNKQVMKKLKKYSDGDVESFTKLPIYIQFDVNKDVIGGFNSAIKVIKTLFMNSTPSDILIQEALDGFNQSGGKAIVSGSVKFKISLDSDKGDEFMSSRKFNMELDGELDGVSNIKNSSNTDGGEGDNLPKYFWWIKWNVHGSEANFSLLGKTEDEEELPLKFINDRLDSGAVVSYVKKHYFHVKTLWVVFLSVGGVFVLGSIIGCLICRRSDDNED